MMDRCVGGDGPSLGAGGAGVGNANADHGSSRNKQRAYKNKSSSTTKGQQDEANNYDTNDGKLSLLQMSSTILLFLGVLSAIFAGTNSKGTLFQSSDNITHALPDAVSTTTQPILIDIQPNDFLADDLIRPSDKVSDTDLFVPPSLFQANTVGAANTLECTHPRKEFGLLDGFQFVAYDICHKINASLRQSVDFRLIVDNCRSSTTEEETNGRFVVRSALVPLSQINPRGTKILAILPRPSFATNKSIHQVENTSGAPDLLGPTVSDNEDAISILLSLLTYGILFLESILILGLLPIKRVRALFSEKKKKKSSEKKSYHQKKREKERNQVINQTSKNTAEKAEPTANVWPTMFSALNKIMGLFMGGALASIFHVGCIVDTLALVMEALPPPAAFVACRSSLPGLILDNWWSWDGRVLMPGVLCYLWCLVLVLIGPQRITRVKVCAAKMCVPHGRQEQRFGKRRPKRHGRREYRYPSNCHRRLCAKIRRNIQKRRKQERQEQESNSGRFSAAFANFCFWKPGYSFWESLFSRVTIANLWINFCTSFKSWFTPQAHADKDSSGQTSAPTSGPTIGPASDSTTTSREATSDPSSRPTPEETSQPSSGPTSGPTSDPTSSKPAAKVHPPDPSSLNRKAPPAPVVDDASEADEERSRDSTSSDSTATTTTAPFQIFVKIFSGKTITLGVHLSDTIGDIKTKIHDKVEIAPEAYWLRLFAKNLDNDNKTLEDYNVQKDSTIDMLGRGEGGATTTKKRTMTQHTIKSFFQPVTKRPKTVQSNSNDLEQATTSEDSSGSEATTDDSSGSDSGSQGSASSSTDDDKALRKASIASYPMNEALPSVVKKKLFPVFQKLVEKIFKAGLAVKPFSPYYQHFNWCNKDFALDVRDHTQVYVANDLHDQSFKVGSTSDGKKRIEQRYPDKKRVKTHSVMDSDKLCPEEDRFIREECNKEVAERFSFKPDSIPKTIEDTAELQNETGIHFVLQFLFHSIRYSHEESPNLSGAAFI